MDEVALRVAIMRALEQTADPHSPWTAFADKVVAEYGREKGAGDAPTEVIDEYHVWLPGWEEKVGALLDEIRGEFPGGRPRRRQRNPVIPFIPSTQVPILRV